MNIVCIGGGPAGLYFGMLMKKQDPRHEVVVIERNRAYDTFGWGVVFSDQTLGNLVAADEPTARTILQAFNHWDDIDVFFKGHKVTSRGHGFCGIGRKRLLNILQARCEELGVKLVFETNVTDERAVAADYGADLVIACDGINSGDPRALSGGLPAGRRHAPVPLRLARHQAALRRVHVRVRGDRARLVPGAHLPVRRRNVDVHRRDAGGSLAARGPRPDEPGGGHRASASGCSRRGSTAIRCCPTPRTCAARRSGSSFRASSAATGCTGSTSSGKAGAARADGRCRAHRALLDRLRHEARPRGCDRARALLRRRTAPKAWTRCLPSTRTCARSRC